MGHRTGQQFKNRDHEEDEQVKDINCKLFFCALLRSVDRVAIKNIA